MPVLKRKKEDGTWEVVGGGSNVEIDPSLEIEGMAADAKAVGEAINTLSIDIAEAGAIDIDLEGSNSGEANTINADTLGGKHESELSVANAINADSLGGILAEEYVRHNQLKNTPKAGFIYPLASSVVPEGFLLCNGAEYLRTEYPELFAAIGTIYGAGDSSTTFNVPNLQTRVPVGKGEGYELGDVGGEASHTLTVDELPRHEHMVNQPYSTAEARPFGVTTKSDFTKDYTVINGTTKYLNDHISIGASGGDTKAVYPVITGRTGNNTAHNNMQPYTVVNYIIATGKNTGISVADIIAGAQTLPLGIEFGGTGAINAATARANLEITPENIGAMSMELLWENASPTSEFAPQEIKFDYVGFTLVEIIFYSHITNGFVLSTGHINIDDRKHALFGTAFRSDDTDYDIATRPFTFTVEGINFESSKYNDLVGIDEARGSVKSNVPYKIYGIKGVM